MVSRASPARRAAFEILGRVTSGAVDPASALHAPRYRHLSAADRDLMTEITYGVLRWRNRLDRVLSHHSNRPFRKIDEAARTSLRMALYQILFLERVPAHAAVDEAVALTREGGAPKAAPFVNAVLRNALRSPGAPALPTMEEPLDYLTTTLSHPRWLARRYLDRLGAEAAAARCELHNRPPPVDLRVTRRIDVDAARRALEDEGVDARPIDGVPRALRVAAGAPHASALVADGRVAIHEAASQLVASLVRPGPADRVLDLCAAPGGKAAAVADAAPEGSVVAIELRPRRARLTLDRARHLGAENVHVVVADAARAPLRDRFERVLLDAPCSSLGTVRRNPDIKWRVREPDLGKHHRTQVALLEAALERLAPGGRLVYATCSTEPEENQKVVEAVLSRRSGVSLVPCPDDVPRTSEGYLTTRPERDAMDGFFAAILTRGAPS